MGGICDKLDGLKRVRVNDFVGRGIYKARFGLGGEYHDFLIGDMPLFGGDGVFRVQISERGLGRYQVKALQRAPMRLVVGLEQLHSPAQSRMALSPRQNTHAGKDG